MFHRYIKITLKDVQVILVIRSRIVVFLRGNKVGGLGELKEMGTPAGLTKLGRRINNERV